MQSGERMTQSDQQVQATHNSQFQLMHTDINANTCSENIFSENKQ